MHEAESNAEWLAFGAYTTLGYAALAIHRWIFAPELEANSTGLQFLLVMLNLIAGSCCFIRALRAAWVVAR